MNHQNVTDTVPQKRTETTQKFPCAVEYYPDGVRLVAPAMGGKNPESGKHLRGDIKGWSKSSRRRMRAFLMTNRLPDSYTLAAVTLTIPGYPLQLQEAKTLFEKWRTYAKNQGWPTVWRCEIQKRGQLHWHCICGIHQDDKKAGDFIESIQSSWHKCMKAMGEIEYKCVGEVTNPTQCEFITGRRGLMDWRGAKKYSCHVDLMSDQESGWKRYLFDHTTKAKQEQIPENIGRHWGKICKKAFVETLPAGVAVMSRKQYARFTRCLNRMWTPYLKHEGALFGRRRGYTVKRGKMGKTDLFTKSLPTVERLADWAVSHA